MPQIIQEYHPNNGELTELINSNSLAMSDKLDTGKAKKIGQEIGHDTSDLINEFLIESYENLDQLDRDLLTLEQDPTSQKTLASLFRTMHTIKGTCGFFGFSKLESVTHIGENLLGRLRDGDLEVNSEIATALLALVDAIQQLLNCIELDRNEDAGDYSAFIEELTRLQERQESPAVSEFAAETSVAEPVELSDKAPIELLCIPIVT
jgi:two-component system chemotaxis sensor kinase CheA